MVKLNWKGKRKDVEKQIKKYNKKHNVDMGRHVNTGQHSDVDMGVHADVDPCVHNPLVKSSVNPLKKDNSNNIITKSLKKKILSMGWTGSLEEIIKMYNEDPGYVKAWVEIIDKVDLYPRAGLLRKSLRSGEKPPTESDKRNRYLEDPLAEFLED